MGCIAQSCILSEKLEHILWILKELKLTTRLRPKLPITIQSMHNNSRKHVCTCIFPSERFSNCSNPHRPLLTNPFVRRGDDQRPCT